MKCIDFGIDCLIKIKMIVKYVYKKYCANDEINKRKNIDWGLINFYRLIIIDSEMLIKFISFLDFTFDVDW